MTFPISKLLTPNSCFNVRPSSSSIAIGRPRFRQELERDVPLEPSVAGAVDDPHPTAADSLFDPIVRHHRADQLRLHGTRDQVERGSLEEVLRPIHEVANLWPIASLAGSFRERLAMPRRFPARSARRRSAAPPRGPGAH